MSEPERSVASTTIVSEARPAIVRLRAGKHQRNGLNPGGISEIAACVATIARYSPRLLGGYGTSAPLASTRERRATDFERARVRGGVDAERHPADHEHARRREPATEPAGDLEPVLTGPPRAHDRDRRRVGVAQRGEARRVARHVQHRRRVGGVREPRRVGVVVAADGVQPGGGDALARGVGVEASRERARARRGAPRRARRADRRR